MIHTAYDTKLVAIRIQAHDDMHCDLNDGHWLKQMFLYESFDFG